MILYNFQKNLYNFKKNYLKKNRKDLYANHLSNEKQMTNNL